MLSSSVGPEEIKEYLGVLKFRDTKAEEKNEVGLATGLAWTEVGGQILTIEAQLMQGKGKLLLTGKAGRCDAGIGPGRHELCSVTRRSVGTRS